MPSGNIERNEKIKELSKEGLSSGEISKRLGLLGYVCSRNAVVGVWHRLNIPHAPPAERRAQMYHKPITPDQAQRDAELKAKREARQQDREAKQKVMLPANEPLPIGPHNDFPPAGTCQYTNDDVAAHDWRMCGAAALDGTHWCEWHWHHVIRNQAPARTGGAARIGW